MCIEILDVGAEIGHEDRELPRLRLAGYRAVHDAESWARHDLTNDYRHCVRLSGVAYASVRLSQLMKFMPTGTIGLGKRDLSRWLP